MNRSDGTRALRRNHHRPSTPPDPDFIFATPSSPSEMCAADDIFRHDKLLPLGTSPLPPPLPPPRTRKAHSVSDHHRTTLGWLTGRREYRKLRTPATESSSAAARPRWYVFAFRAVKVQEEMKMEDIRSRQRRRSAPAIAGDMASGQWKLLRSLSCKGMESAAVAVAPMRFV